MTPLRKNMKIAYGEETYHASLDKFSENDFLESAENVVNGVPIATPVLMEQKSQMLMKHLKERV